MPANHRTVSTDLHNFAYQLQNSILCQLITELYLMTANYRTVLFVSQLQKSIICLPMREQYLMAANYRAANYRTISYDS